MRRGPVLLLSMLCAGWARAAGPQEALGDTAQAVTTRLGAAPPIEIKVLHPFSRVMARERVVQLLDYWSHRFGVKAQWTGFRVFLAGKVWGVDFQARFEVGEHEVVALSTDPGFFFRRQASSYAEGKLRKYLNVNYDEP